MININVIAQNNIWLNYIKRPNYYLHSRIQKLNQREKKFKKKKLFCTLLLSGNKEIRYLNKKFRKKNKTTDVLSFPFYTKNEYKKKFKSEKELYLGDIIINLNKIKDKKNKKNFKLEFDKLWIHGLAHLLGHDHKRNKDFKKMQLIEKKYFKLVND